ncbi:hypothetical protein EV646_101647 [Kribbella antiqua]|uniref:MYXO-CTERM domain-containing protein n=1 Tax=Kribbella antiqua TaxID=2512217 RepID=A0A4R2J152_9ACTN|nr:hypothetical protein [Kribbella antiqua]TCO51654.1 hypothetical protein EV646_101647 [Kribbella antiqua]
MKHICTLVALPILTCGVVMAVSDSASAKEPPPDGSVGPGVVVVHDPGPTVQVDDNVAEGLQAGAAALGGAGITMAALWAYRRRHPLGAH